MGKIVIIHPDGTVEEMTQNTPVEYKQLQELVGGRFEILSWPTHNLLYEGKQAQFFLDEEGKIKGLEKNQRAYEITQFDRWALQHDYPAGKLVILTGKACAD